MRQIQIRPDDTTANEQTSVFLPDRGGHVYQLLYNFPSQFSSFYVIFEVLPGMASILLITLILELAIGQEGFYRYCQDTQAIESH